MTPERWRRVQEMFDAALDCDDASRETLLARAAEEDPALASDVRSLLATHARTGEFLESPAWAVAPDLLLPSPTDSKPLIVGPYRILEEVGRGGMGIVYAAEDTRLGRIVALKALPSEYGSDPVRRERLAREARAAAAVAHPGVATVFALEEIDGHLYIASELVRGQTLRAELANGALPLVKAIDTAIDIADALDAAHTQGVIHRDLKPENVVRRADGGIKVLDFGLAKLEMPGGRGEATLTVQGTLLGTPGYMAPEQLRGDPIDARADLFAFGVLAYELATGVHPFGGGDPASLIARLVDGDPPFARTIDPPALHAILRRCLRSSPAERYESARAMAADLRELRESVIEDLPPDGGSDKGMGGSPGGGAGSGARGSGAPSSGARSSAARGRDSASPLTADVPADAPDGALWWWRFHQLAVACLVASAIAPAWIAHSWMGKPRGSIVFLAILVSATIATTIRAHLWFTARVHADTLAAHRRRVFPWLAACEGAIAALTATAGLLVAGNHDATAAWLFIIALLTFISLVVIEPATTRAAALRAIPNP
jgi:serine/threonine protein kinase